MKCYVDTWYVTDKSGYAWAGNLEELVVGERAQDVCGTATHHQGRALWAWPEYSSVTLHSPPCHRGRHCPERETHSRLELVSRCTRRTVSGTLSYPMALLHHRWQVGLVIFFPWVLFALVAFNLYLEIIVDLQKSCKEHTHNFHIPLSQFPLIFRDNGTFVKTENFNLDATLFTEYLLLFLRFSHGYPCLFQDPRPGPVLPLVTLSP